MLQGTKEWLEAKKSRIGGSEIYSLVFHYCKKELKALGVDLLKEQPFLSVQELFLQKKFGIDLLEINPILAEFGNQMEDFVNWKVSNLYPNLEIEAKKDYLTKGDRLGCSPDGYLTITDGGFADYDDIDKEITSSLGVGMHEAKTSNYFKAKENTKEGGAKMQYIFQLQYNMLITGCNWGLLSVVSPLESEFDKDYLKGKIVGKLESKGVDAYEEINGFYDLHTYFYVRNPVFETLINKALDCFFADLQKEGFNYPREQEFSNETVFNREKKMLVKLRMMSENSDGILYLQEEEELNQLINERMIAASVLKETQKEKTNIEAKIANHLIENEAIMGTQYKAYFSSDNKLLFKKL
jgi:hypothetical protein